MEARKGGLFSVVFATFSFSYISGPLLSAALCGTFDNTPCLGGAPSVALSEPRISLTWQGGTGGDGAGGGASFPCGGGRWLNYNWGWDETHLTLTAVL